MIKTKSNGFCYLSPDGMPPDGICIASGSSPLTITNAENELIKFLRIDGNTVNGAGVGDPVTDSASKYAGKYAVPFTLSGINLVNEPETVEITNSSANKSYKQKYTTKVIDYSQFTASCILTRYDDDITTSNRINIELSYSDNTSAQFNGFFETIHYGLNHVFVCATANASKTLRSVTVRWADYGSATNRHCKIENMMLLAGKYTSSTLPKYEAYFAPENYTVYLEKPLYLNESAEIKNSSILLHNGTNILTPMSIVSPKSLYVKYIKRT